MVNNFRINIKIGSLGQNIGKNGSIIGEKSVYLQGKSEKIGSHFTRESVELTGFSWSDFFLFLSSSSEKNKEGATWGFKKRRKR